MRYTLAVRLNARAPHFYHAENQKKNIGLFFVMLFMLFREEICHI